jgi:hypothetical protein
MCIRSTIAVIAVALSILSAKMIRLLRSNRYHYCGHDRPIGRAEIASNFAVGEVCRHAAGLVLGEPLKAYSIRLGRFRHA